MNILIKKLTLGNKFFLFLLIFFSFIKISFSVWIFYDIYVLDILLLFIFFVYFIDNFLGFKTRIISIEKYLLYFLVFSMLQFIIIAYRGDINFLRIKTAFSGFVVLLYFCCCIIIFSNKFKNSDFLVVVARYFYYFCFINFIYITVSFIILDSSRTTRILPLIEGFLPFKESVLYVYGYTLSACLINNRWKLIDVSVLVASSIINFVMFYRSLSIIWILLTIILVMITVKRTKRSIKTMVLICSMLILTIFSIIVFRENLENNIKQMVESTYDEIENIPILLKMNYPFDEVTSFTNRYGYSRIFIWLQAFQNIKSNPLLGHGIGYENYLGAKNKIISIYSGKQNYLSNYHNPLLGCLVNYGFIGTFFLYLIFFKIWFLGVRLLKKNNISKIKKHSIYSFITIYIIYFIGSVVVGVGGIIPDHPTLYVAIPLWLFMAAVVAEYKRKV